MALQQTSLLRVGYLIVAVGIGTAGCAQKDAAEPGDSALTTEATAAASATPEGRPIAATAAAATKESEPTPDTPASKQSDAASVVEVDPTPRPPATVADAIQWIDLRTFPVFPGTDLPGDRRQVGELHYEAPGELQEVFDFQRQELEKLGWQLLPDARLDGENPMADFTQHGFLVSVSVSGYSQQPGHVSVWLKNHGNVLPGSLPTPEGVEPFYSSRSQASYVTTRPADETAEAVWKLILDQGWTPYGHAAEMRYFKQNAILLSADVRTHDAHPGKAFITYSTEQLSSDLPVPEDVDDPRYTDSMKRLHFDHPEASPAELAAFYNEHLGKLGWQPTSEPVGEETVSVVYRNDAKDMITLDMRVYNDLTRVDVEHHTADEIAALETQLRQNAALAQQEAAEEAQAEAARMETARIEFPLPGHARDVEQDDEHNLTFTIATGAGKELLEQYEDHFQQAGWETGTSTLNDNFGMLQMEKDDMRLGIDFVDTGLGRAVEIDVSSSRARLIVNQDASGFAELGGLSPPPPIPQEVLQQAPADIAIPADARELQVRPNANVAYKVAARVDRVARSFREAMERHGWTHHDTDLDEDHASVSFRKGRAPVSASMHQFEGGIITSVTIAGGGINWQQLRSADQPLDPPVGTDPAPPRVAEVADIEMPPDALADVEGEAPAEPADGRLLAEGLAVPEAAADLERDPDTEMVIFRSDMKATQIADFYREALAASGWSEIDDETFVDDGIGVGAVSFEKGDWGIRLAIQDGRPESRSRVIIMGEGLAWSSDEGEPFDSPEVELPEEQPVAAQLAGKGTCRGTIFFGDAKYELKHALAAVRMESDEPVTRLYLNSEPFVKNALATIARDSASIIDIVDTGFPPCIEIRLGESYSSFSCFVDGASINLGSATIQSTVEQADGQLAGRVHLEEAHEVFDKPFRFDVEVEIKLEDGKTLAGEPGVGGLSVNERYALLVPMGCSQVTQGGSPYLESLQASIDAELADVVAFYRDELTQRGWTEDADRSREEESSAEMHFVSDEGPLDVEFKRRRGETMIDVSLRQEKLAQQHGIVPPEGKSMLILGNATEAAIQIVVDGKSHSLAAEQGARDPSQAVKLTLAPGKHTVSVPNSDPETFEVPAGACWGVIITPDGGLYSDRLY